MSLRLFIFNYSCKNTTLSQIKHKKTHSPHRNTTRRWVLSLLLSRDFLIKYMTIAIGHQQKSALLIEFAGV